MGLRHYIEVPEKHQPNTYRVEIDEDFYSGSSSEIICTDVQPLLIKQRVFETDGRVWLYSKSVSIAFPVKDTTEEASFDYLFQNFYQRVRVDILKNGVLDFRGYLQPEKSSKDLLTFPKVIKIIASDGLDLADKFDIEGAVGFPDPSEVEILDVFVQAFIRLKNRLPINVRYNTYETTYMTSTEQLMKEATVLSERFRKTVSGEVRIDTVKEALEKCLLTCNCNLTQSQGKWWISSNAELDSAIHQYDQDGVFLGRITDAVTVNLWDLCSDDNGTIKYLPTTKSVKVYTRLSSFIGYANPNPNFLLGGTGWTPSVDWWTFNFANSICTLVDQFGYSAVNDYSMVSDSFTIFAPASQDFDIIFDMRHQVSALTKPAGSAPKVTFSYNVDGGSFIEIITVYFNDIDLGVWRDFQTSITFNVPGSFQMVLKVEFDDDGPGTNKWTFLEYKFDQISALPSYASDIKYDELATIRDTGASPDLNTAELEQFLSGDAPNNTTAAFLIKNNAGPFNFARYQKTENLPLNGILGLEILNREYTYRKLITVNYHKTIPLLETHNTVLFAGQRYQILAYGFDVYNGICNLTLKELHAVSEGDVSYSLIVQSLTTIDGEKV